MKTVRISRLFWNDHADRSPLNPGEQLAQPVHLAQHHATFNVADQGLSILYADAVYYADPGTMDECPENLRAAAKRTLAALDKAGVSL